MGPFLQVVLAGKRRRIVVAIGVVAVAIAIGGAWARHQPPVEDDELVVDPPQLRAPAALPAFRVLEPDDARLLAGCRDQAAEDAAVPRNPAQVAAVKVEAHRLRGELERRGIDVDSAADSSRPLDDEARALLDRVRFLRSLRYRFVRCGYSIVAEAEWRDRCLQLYRRLGV
jgi:hypothetical protein